jgi:glycerol-3-phosphate dehydrogenase (NAD(P)+)
MLMLIPPVRGVYAAGNYHYSIYSLFISTPHEAGLFFYLCDKGKKFMPRSYDADVSVIGSGSWATAIVKLLSSNTSRICWFIQFDDILKHIKKYHHNPGYLSAIDFNPGKLMLTGDINKAVRASGTIILVTPAAFLKETLKPLTVPFKGKIIASAIKGFIPEDNCIVGEFLHMNYNIPYSDIVIITGPSHAEEVAMEKLTYLTVASQNSDNAKKVAAGLKNHYLRTIISDDIFGTEYASVMKNIYAIASGICIGLGYGDNFLAVLLSNAAMELKAFIDSIHPIDRDIKSSAYLGDLLVTGYSQFSRNRSLGTMIGKGYSVNNALLGMTMVAEGYYASKGIHTLRTKMKLRIPIAETVYRILYENANPSKEIHNLTKILR